MKPYSIVATAFLLASSLALPSFAEDCQLPSMAKPVNSFSSVAKAPRSWKSERVQKKLRATLSRIRKSKAAEPATADHPLDDVDYFCDDWIAICANEDCTHGVVDCDGVCAPF